MRKLPRIKTRKIKKLLLNILLLFFSIIIALLFIEIFLRIFLPQNLNITKVDAEKIFEHKPNIESVLKRQEFVTHVKINSQGLRDKDYSLNKPPNTIRTAFVGDSFVFGYGVELNESMVKILESKLNLRQNKNYEVINFGVSGYQTEQEYLFTKSTVVNYDPDIIIFAFSFTDLKENAKFNIFDVKNNTLIKNPPQKITPMLRLRNYISWHSHLYSLIYFSVIDNNNLRNFLVKIKLLNPPYKNPETDFDSLIYLNSKNDEFDYTINKTLLLLKEMYILAKKNKIDLAVLIIPTKEQVDKGKMAEYAKSKNLDANALNITKVQEIIKSEMQKKDVIVIDPLEQFRKRNINNSFYYDIDGHWDKEGHAFAANTVYENLIKLRLVT